MTIPGREFQNSRLNSPAITGKMKIVEDFSFQCGFFPLLSPHRRKAQRNQTMNPSDKIRKRIETKVDSFWANSAMSWINKVLSGNRHFVKDVDSIRIRVNRGYIAKLTCNVTIQMPDCSATATKQITYTHSRGKHKIALA